MWPTVAFSFCVCLLVGNVFANVGRIAGGESITIQRYPFAVALLTNSGQGSYQHACGGTILTTNAILSAASCFYNEQLLSPAEWWRARVGSTYSGSGGYIYMVRQIVPNPDFSPTTLANDIAVLRTTLDMLLTPGSVEVARISGGAYTFGINQPVRAIGWGAVSNQDLSSSNVLQEAQIWTILSTTCSNRYDALNFTITENMVCVGWLDVGVRGQCVGDNGSPLLDEEGFVVGVFSRGDGCAQGWYPDVNTRVSPYLRWIRSVVY